MATTPLDTLEAVLNTARTRLLDAIASLGGDILTDVNVFTPTVTNAAWRRWQELLVKYGYSGLKGQVLFSNIPASTSNDSAIPVYFNYAGYFDGTTLHSSFPLPQDMIAPDVKPGSISERINGITPISVAIVEADPAGLSGGVFTAINVFTTSNLAGVYPGGTLALAGYSGSSAGLNGTFSITTVFPGTPNSLIQLSVSITNTTVGSTAPTTGSYVGGSDQTMTDLGGPETQGLPIAPLGPWNKIWEWRQDTLYLPGATNNLDIRIRYFAYYPDFVFPVGIQTVPIIRSLNGFAWLIAAEMSKSRADPDAADFEAKADAAAQVVLGRDGISAPEPGGE